MYSPQASVPTVSKRKVFCSLPYYGYITDQIKSDIKSIVDKHLHQIGLKLIFVNNCAFGFKNQCTGFLKTNSFLIQSKDLKTPKKILYRKT